MEEGKEGWVGATFDDLAEDTGRGGHDCCSFDVALLWRALEGY
jgi:hypothetical protein